MRVGVLVWTGLVVAWAAAAGGEGRRHGEALQPNDVQDIPLNAVFEELALHELTGPLLTRDDLLAMPKHKLVDYLMAKNGWAEAAPATDEPSAPPVPHDPQDADFGFPPIWPAPASVSVSDGGVAVDPNLEFVVKGESADVVAGLDRFYKRTFTNPAGKLPPGVVAEISVSVHDPATELQLGVDESYTLTVTTSAIAIEAATQFGLFHGLETLSQLIVFDAQSQTYNISRLWSITDAPRFAHRELLIDTSRHFQTITSIQDIVDSMTYAKLNVLHWHLVDEQAFPFQAPSHPELAQQGAYSSFERYTAEDVAAVVEFARQRGVRVMAEFDTPGHADAMCASHPEICPALPGCIDPLNPATNATFDLLADVLGDLTGGKAGAGLFPDNVIHLGGDEVNTQCWEQDPAIVAWMKDNNFTSTQAYFYFVQRVQAIARDMGRAVVGWGEIWDAFGTSLDKSTIIHEWRSGSKVAQECTAAGYRALFSSADVWYLDNLGRTWDQMYAAEPCTDIPDAACDSLVLGGGGEMWGETVDVSDALQTIWPRAAAIAERLWSPRTVTNTTQALPRLQSFRCLLNQRAVPAAPVKNAQARTGPSGPGSCFAQ